MAHPVDNDVGALLAKYLLSQYTDGTCFTL